MAMDGAPRYACPALWEEDAVVGSVKRKANNIRCYAFPVNHKRPTAVRTHHPRRRQWASFS